jgi:spore germination cell wall hydrolase CwlJ-like protein
MRIILATLLAILLSLLVVTNVAPSAINSAIDLEAQATYCKAFTVMREAGGESLKGKRAVLDVVENRMRLRNLSACQVMSQKAQFSFFTKNTEVRVSKEALTDYFRVANMRRVLKKDVEYFHNVDVTPEWAGSMINVSNIGRHKFYADRQESFKLLASN